MDNTMENKNIRRRRQWIVSPRFQIQFAAVLVLLQINVGIFFQGVLHYRMRHLASEAGSLKAFLETDLWTASLPAMAIAAVATGVIVFLIGIRYSNQIVGPVPRITRTLHSMAQGEDPPRLKFRPGDVLEELADEVNRLADHLQSQANPAAPRPAEASPRSSDPQPADEVPVA